ncbi:hypothetical protein [Paraburkholderia susongensis]|uniref:Tox-PAAR-like domain-containing protein n=1 Tax=Paraburkholderia susongensis TaxID=1515439 RepID=A0A1X7M4T1_9BURK|nr:hypothetical protein [Paraburkholderia susongensis]SMG61105.1 hypothetical protein SAMN06265784_11967 [Paraburkholderia susongensis]
MNVAHRSGSIFLMAAADMHFPYGPPVPVAVSTRGMTAMQTPVNMRILYNGTDVTTTANDMTTTGAESMFQAVISGARPGSVAKAIRGSQCWYVDGKAVVRNNDIGMNTLNNTVSTMMGSTSQYMNNG